MPVAGTILVAGRKHAWRCAWLRLLRLLRPAIPPTWAVIVLADRGFYARWLFRRIVRLGWHPFLRINTGATCRPAGQARWSWLHELIPPDGTHWHGDGTCCKDRRSQLACPLLIWSDEASAAPWCVITDLAPDAADIAWYGLRAWCEQGFKCTKRGGWQGNRPR